jgi:hypothetical protein
MMDSEGHERRQSAYFKLLPWNTEEALNDQNHNKHQYKQKFLHLRFEIWTSL